MADKKMSSVYKTYLNYLQCLFKNFVAENSLKHLKYMLLYRNNHLTQETPVIVKP